MDRFGVPTAPEGCGNDPHEGPCFSCSIRALRRGRHLLRQLLPLRYHTHYTTGGEGVTFVNVDTWRMWFGRVFGHRRATYSQFVPQR
jgi:hypothetical protein